MRDKGFILFMAALYAFCYFIITEFGGEIIWLSALLLWLAILLPATIILTPIFAAIDNLIERIRYP